MPDNEYTYHMHQEPDQWRWSVYRDNTLLASGAETTRAKARAKALIAARTDAERLESDAASIN